MQGFETSGSLKPLGRRFPPGFVVGLDRLFYQKEMSPQLDGQLVDLVARVEVRCCNAISMTASAADLKFALTCRRAP
jgi:hypothetical protein